MAARVLIFLTACLIASGALFAAAAEAQDDIRTFRDWEPFDVGAWKQVRVCREAINGETNAVTTSITETKTTLIEKDDKGFALRVEVTVEVAGKKFPSPPQTIWYGYNGETKGQAVTTEKIGNEQLDIDGKTIVANLYQITIDDKTTRRTIQAACSDQFPFVYRLRSVQMETEGQQQRELDVLQADVMFIDLPYRVLGEIRPVSHVCTTLQRSDAKTVTVEVHCQEVPGRVVARWSRKTDSNPRVLERSTLELLDYGTAAAEQDSRVEARRPIFGRHRAARVSAGR